MYIKKIVVYVFLFTFIFGAFQISEVYANTDLGTDYSQKSENATTIAKNFLVKINDAILFPLIAFLMAVALLIFLYGAFEYVRGASNDASREQGKKHLLYGTIGLLVMLSAVALLSIAVATFGLQRELESAQSLNPSVGAFRVGNKNGYAGVSSRTLSDRSSIRSSGLKALSSQSESQSADRQVSSDALTKSVSIEDYTNNDAQYVSGITGEDIEPVTSTDNDSEYTQQPYAENQEVLDNKPFTLDIADGLYAIYKDQINTSNDQNYITQESIKGYVSLPNANIVDVDSTSESYISECNDINGTDVVSVDIGYAFDFYCVDSRTTITRDEAIKQGLTEGHDSDGGFWSILPWVE